MFQLMSRKLDWHTRFGAEVMTLGTFGALPRDIILKNGRKKFI